MSMLAEPRSRQKWSHDPRNTNWANDKQKFGYTMLTKMGWSEGNGLGANLSGNTSHIKVNKRGSNAGIGLKKSHEDDWIGHQDDFNALLNSLNGKPAAETAAPVEKMRATKHRYTKFVKSKDLSNASTDDLACIFGKRGVKEAKKESDSSETESAPEEEEEEKSLKTIESTLSVNDYFAKKMAALKQKNMFANSPICMSNVSKNDSEKPSVDDEDKHIIPSPQEQVCEPEKKKKKKKKSKDIDESDNPCVETKIESDVLVASEIVKKKKKKKSKESCANDTIPLIPSPCSDTKTDTNEFHEDSSEGIKKKKKKKKSKENIDETSLSCTEVNDKESVDIVLENGLVKKRRKEREQKRIILFTIPKIKRNRL